ncbi:metal ion binding [Ascochyta rabiei]|uniref:Metal ion binding n=1 Tax=Didymella rabiei TaxID=5454 RepID=A0A163KYA1_DIDRA|nr:metal ion binding [Ascochyta rabiei]
MDDLDARNSSHDVRFVALSELSLDSPAMTPFDLQPHAAGLDSYFNSCSASPTVVSSTTNATLPKQGGRFSKEAIRVLKTWLRTHENRPYPRPEDLQFLQQQTGLDCKQITTWFANARRRDLSRAPRPHSPQVTASPVDIIARPATPAVQLRTQHENLLQRWVESPPEQEAALFGDIVRAVATRPDHTGDKDCKPEALYYSSSASSAGTSFSNPLSDCNSSGSRKSYSLSRKPRRRRVKKSHRPREGHAASQLPFQCTFCVETFKTKYDWQRHEKALHLSLEQWTCAPEGPRASVLGGSGELCCVFCGELSPDDAHLNTHQYSACQARDEGERSFHRKDHLVQHLKLVHKVDSKHVQLDRWKTSTLDVQSRCGFCTLAMSTWTERVNHLADHFKAGATMSQWQGDWGFEDHVLERVEDSVPPYFIHLEMNTPWPLRASDTPIATLVNAYELLKFEVNFFRQNYLDKNGSPPNHRAFQLEACRTVFASDALSDKKVSTPQRDDDESWLRDLIMSNPDITQEALFGPLRTPSEGISTLRIYGRTHLFEQCPLENQLLAFVRAQADAGLPDWRLQQEACDIIRRAEASSNATLEGFSDWVIHAIGADSDWLLPFKLRVGLDIGDQFNPAAVPSLESVDHQQVSAPFFPEAFTHVGLPENSSNAPIHYLAAPPSASNFPDSYSQSNRSMGPNFFRLFTGDLRRWVFATMSPSNPGSHVPSDTEIQHHARWIMYESDDPWNQTAADHPEWLWRFKKDVGILREGEAAVGGDPGFPAL